MDKLREEIAIEREYIDKTLEVLRGAMLRPEKTVIELSAIGSCLHHSYTGIENILKRICNFQHIQVPHTPSSHKDLLDIVLRYGIISDDLSEKLDKYRGFRHFFVHGYGVLLDEEELQPLADEFPEVWNQFQYEIEDFFEKFQHNREIVS